MERQLRAFQNDTDTVVAYDLEDLLAFYTQDFGLSADEVELDGYRELPPDTLVSITWPKDDWQDRQERRPQRAVIQPAEERYGCEFVKVTAPVSAWIVAEGRGVLCSTEWV